MMILAYSTLRDVTPVHTRCVPAQSTPSLTAITKRLNRRLDAKETHSGPSLLRLGTQRSIILRRPPLLGTKFRRSCRADLLVQPLEIGFSFVQRSQRPGITVAGYENEGCVVGEARVKLA